MRRLVGAIALLIAAFFLFLLIPFPDGEPLQGQAGESAPAGFGIRSAEIADDGGSKAAVLRIFLLSDGARNLSA
ncbi:MAG: hypothetical protein WC717_06330, partial [Candidatus Micrarchaeia archaeon]